MYNPFSLANKTILVTGASSGIGRATAIECSKMGAKLIVAGRNEERLKDTYHSLIGSGHSLIIGDLTKEEDIKRLINEIPNIEGAVLCAGIGMTVPIQFATREKFNLIFETNFFAQTELTRMLFKKKILNKNSSLVFISSIGGITSFNYGNSVYGCSKAALNSFMRFCAKEFASREIRTNAICPGMVETPLITGKTISDEQREIYKSHYLIKRFAKPEEIAYGAIYLLSDASAWITGICLQIDGGGTTI